MRVRIAYTVDVSDEFRAAINNFYDLPGLALREDVRQFFCQYGESMNEDIMVQYHTDTQAKIAALDVTDEETKPWQ